MKRGFVDSNQPFGSLENSKVKQKYQNLLEDYLDLQKEYVSKKRKLRVANQKKEILLDEVRFLRQRHKYLMKSQFGKVESELHQNADIRDVPFRKERNHIVNESYIEQKDKVIKELPLKTPSVGKTPNMGKKRKNGLNNGNKSAKRRVSRQDKVALKV